MFYMYNCQFINTLIQAQSQVTLTATFYDQLIGSEHKRKLIKEILANGQKITRVVSSKFHLLQLLVIYLNNDKLKKIYINFYLLSVIKANIEHSFFNFALFYLAPVPGRKVLATIRDCASSTEQDLLQMVSVELKTPAKILVFEECGTSLCNMATKHPLFNFTLFLLLLLFLIS